MIDRLRSLARKAKALLIGPDDNGSEVVQVAILAAGLAALALTVMGAIKLFVDGEISSFTG